MRKSLKVARFSNIFHFQSFQIFYDILSDSIGWLVVSNMFFSFFFQSQFFLLALFFIGVGIPPVGPFHRIPAESRISGDPRRYLVSPWSAAAVLLGSTPPGRAVASHGKHRFTDGICIFYTYHIYIYIHIQIY